MGAQNSSEREEARTTWVLKPVLFETNMEMLPPMSNLALSLRKGIYKHYSGKQYEVLSVGRNEESLEEVVIYRALYAPRDVWVRSLSKFVEKITLPNGEEQARFQFIRENS